MDLRKLLKKVETAPVGSTELDNEFASTFRGAPPNVTRSIDAAVQLIETGFRAGGGTAGIAPSETVRLSTSLALAAFERTSRARVWIQTVNHALRICGCSNTRGGVSFSTTASIAIAVARFRLPY